MVSTGTAARWASSSMRHGSSVSTTRSTVDAPDGASSVTGMEHAGLTEALERHVHDGDAIHLVLGHSRWTAAARELARLRWGTDPGFTLQMISLGSLSALWFRGGLV